MVLGLPRLSASGSRYRREVRGGFVPDGVTSAETNPLGDRSVLLLRLGELLLRSERLVAL